MGGHSWSWKTVTFISCFLLIWNITPSPKARAYTPLLSLRDVLSDTKPRSVGVTHDISFALPADAAPLRPTDWILISLPNFTNPTPPQFVQGGFGTPTFSVVNGILRITNMALNPGNSLEIFGITANNPNANQNFSVIVAIANDANGTVIRNQSVTLANDAGPTIAVSAIVDNMLSSVNLTGYSSPSAFVTLVANGAVTSTAVTDGAGFFSFPISGLSPGNYDFRISATDTQNRPTAQSETQLFLLPSTLTTVNNIMLSPSIDISTTSIHSGDPITISGASRPASTVNVFVESPLRNYAVTSAADGNWSYTIPGSETATYVPGQYRTYSNVQDSSGNQSIVSHTVNFTVDNPVSTDNPPPACNISHGDLNCDGKVNLTDFSILLSNWHTNHRVADINSNGSVDLVDFSIMMFYFKR
jgi:hypothetical protein